jgi:TolB-like protein/Flp pilus assembly protein TadD
VAVAVVAALLLVAGWWWWRARGPTSTTTIGSIAVLPLENRSGAETEYISDGVTESIINDLSQLPNLKVMSRNSVFRYKGKEIDAQAVAKELNVEAVLTGRVTQRGDALSISVELINARDNSQIWGQQYNRKTADVFEVQQEIARQISDRLRLKLTTEDKQQLAKRPTENLKAFQYYMQAQSSAQRRTPEDLAAAIGFCEKAIAEDPNYALAFAGLADAYANLGARGYAAPLESRRKAEEAARKAISLNPNLAEAHATLGQVYVIYAPSDFASGDNELRQAVELSPSLASARQYLGVSLVRQGRFEESLEQFLKARELDPLSSINARNVALPHYFKRDYARALEIIRQANELGPAYSTTWEVGVYVQAKSFDEALTQLEKAKQDRKNNALLVYSAGMIYAGQGKRAEALEAIKELEAMSGPSLADAHFIAKIYAILNEKEMALTWLERGAEVQAIGAFYKDEPTWDSIRTDARFGELLRRLGIPT